MTSPLESSLRKTIASAASFLFLDATLTRDVPSTSADPAEPGIPTQVSYPCKAIEEQYSAGLIANSVVDSNDVQLLILAETLAVDPLPGDRITIRGITRQVVPMVNKRGLNGVMSDPARATWMCRCS